MKCYKAENRVVTVRIEQPGLYVFEKESAIGKTFLCRILKKCRSYGERTDAYTYTDLTAGRSLMNYLMTTDLDLVMLDRYDMYHGKFEQDIKEIAQKAIVLIDCKNDSNLTEDAQLCFLTLQEDQLLLEVDT